MINTEIMVKLARGRGCTIVEVGVYHFPRTAGAPQGARVRASPGPARGKEDATRT